MTAIDILLDVYKESIFVFCTTKQTKPDLGLTIQDEPLKQRGSSFKNWLEKARISLYTLIIH